MAILRLLDLCSNYDVQSSIYYILCCSLELKPLVGTGDSTWQMAMAFDPRRLCLKLASTAAHVLLDGSAVQIEFPGL